VAEGRSSRVSERESLTFTPARIVILHGVAAATSPDAAAEWVELRASLPVGYVHDADGEVVIDADAEFRTAIGDLFAPFAACGSAYGVVAAFTDRRLARLRRYLGREAALGGTPPTPASWGC